MAQPAKPTELPQVPMPPPMRRRESSDDVLLQILAELRAIREAIARPRQTAERENAEFLSSIERERV